MSRIAVLILACALSCAESLAEEGAAACDVCHARGENQAPPLDGQKPVYLRNQLLQFRSGMRVNALMAPIARELTDEDIERLVEHYSRKQAARVDRANQTLDPAARPLVFCVRCHGADGISPNALWPNLAGLDADYMRRQIEAYAAEQRRDDMMKSWGARLEGEALKRVLEYFAAAETAARETASRGDNPGD